MLLIAAMCLELEAQFLEVAVSSVPGGHLEHYRGTKGSTRTCFVTWVLPINTTKIPALLHICQEIF